MKVEGVSCQSSLISSLGLGGRAGITPQNFVGGVQLCFSNPHPILDQNMQFFCTLFQT